MDKLSREDRDVESLNKTYSIPPPSCEHPTSTSSVQALREGERDPGILIITNGF
jgi:hypothetical protein